MKEVPYCVDGQPRVTGHHYCLLLEVTLTIFTWSGDWLCGKKRPRLPGGFKKPCVSPLRAPWLPKRLVLTLLVLDARDEGHPGNTSQRVGASSLHLAPRALCCEAACGFDAYSAFNVDGIL